MKFMSLVIASVLALPAVAQAQSYPERPVTLVVPYSAGAGAGDRMGRMLAQKLGERLGKAVVVDNKAGADATIGTMFVANAKPDGYTVLQGDSGPLAIVPAMRKVNYDPRDLVPVGPTVSLPYVLGVSSKLGVKTFADLVKLAKASPGTLNYASSSAMSILGMELLKRKTGVAITHIPYPGATGALNSILGGQTSMMVLNPLALKPFLDAGQLIAVGIGAPSRSPVLPDVPTFEELGIPGVDVQTYVGLFAPRGTPREVLTRLNQALAEVMEDPSVQKDLAAQGAVVLKDHSSENFARLMDAERQKWQQIVLDAGLGEGQRK